MADDQPPDRDDGGADVGAKRYPTRPPQQQSDATSKRRPRWGFIVLGVVVVIGAVLGVLYWLAHRDEIVTDDAFTDGRSVTIAPRISGSVVSLDVNDNQFVHAGQRLLQIDPSDYATARNGAQGDLAAVQAQLANARANLAITQVTQPARLAQAQAQLASAQANAVKAQRDYQRFHSIDPAATTRQSVEQATAGDRVAAAQVAQAEAQVAQASTVKLDVKQAEAQISQLEAQQTQAAARLAQANLNLGYTQILAPQDGWIARRNVETGNYVTPGMTVLALVTPDIWVTGNFKEDQLARMRPGQRVRLHVDAYPHLRLEGHVDSVQLGSGSRFSAFPAENATGNFVKIVQRVPVKIVIDRGLDPKVPLPLGISVEPTVFVK